MENVDYASADMGNDFDDAFDTVMWVEDFTFDEVGKIISINLEDQVKKGQLVKQKGTTIREGEAVLKKADVLNPFRLGLLATAGIGELSVVAKPRVAYLPTGSELIPAGQTPKRGQNVESNSLMVEATLQSWGADMVKIPIVADQRTDLAKALDDALQKADIVLLNGGTSMGTEDYTSALLSKRASYFQHGCTVHPGHPGGGCHRRRKAGHKSAGAALRGFLCLGLVRTCYGVLLERPARATAKKRYCDITKAPAQTAPLRDVCAAGDTGRFRKRLHR